MQDLRTDQMTPQQLAYYLQQSQAYNTRPEDHGGEVPLTGNPSVDAYNAKYYADGTENQQQWNSLDTSSAMNNNSNSDYQRPNEYHNLMGISGIGAQVGQPDFRNSHYGHDDDGETNRMDGEAQSWMESNGYHMEQDTSGIQGKGMIGYRLVGPDGQVVPGTQKWGTEEDKVFQAASMAAVAVVTAGVGAWAAGGAGIAGAGGASGAMADAAAASAASGAGTGAAVGATAGGVGASSTAEQIALMQANGMSAAEISAATGGQVAGYTAADVAAMAAGTGASGGGAALSTAPGGTAPATTAPAATTPSAANPSWLDAAKAAGKEYLPYAQTAAGAAGLINNALNPPDAVGSGGTGPGGTVGGTDLADKQYAQLRELLDWQTKQNRVNQVTPDGQQAWTQDANGNWTQTTSLSPTQQKTYDTQQGVNQQRTNVAAGLGDQLAQNFSTPFNAPKYGEYIADAGKTNTNSEAIANGVNSQIQGYTPFTDKAEFDTTQQTFQRNPQTQALIQDWIKSSGYTGNVQDVLQDATSFLTDVNKVNQVAPQFSNEMVDRYSKAAYDSQYGLMKDDLDQRDTRIRNLLALQGLTPGTEASTNALQSYENGRANQLNSLASSSLLTGNTMANQDYDSMLAGFKASNDAQGQAYDQGIGTFDTTNKARTQSLTNALARYNADQIGLTNANAARTSQFNQDQSVNKFNLEAQVSANDARQKQFASQLDAYGANLKGVIAANDARTTQFGQNKDVFELGNRAQGQAYNQGVQNYGIDYTAANAARNQPLTDMNALLSGTGVAQPTFGNFALAGSNAASPNYLGQAQLTAQQQQAAQQSQASNNNLWGNLLGNGLTNLFGTKP